jgi:putative ABC transport system substrate-binding protein
MADKMNLSEDWAGASRAAGFFEAAAPGPIYNPEDQNKAVELSQMKAAAMKLSLAVWPYEARSVEEIDAAFAAISGEHRQAVVILSDGLMVIQQKRLAELSVQNRIPAMFGFREFAAAGGLVSYGASLNATYHQAASYVD